MARNSGPASRRSGESPDDESPENRRGDDESAEDRRGDDDRESIWSIPARLKRLYFGLFTVQIIVALIRLALDAIADESLVGFQAKILYVWQNMAPAAITSATFALVLTDAWGLMSMVLSTWLADELKKRRQRQLDAAVKKGLAQGRAEGREEGRAEVWAEVGRQWHEWNDRREAAAAAGEEFTEMPPGYTPPPPY